MSFVSRFFLWLNSVFGPDPKFVAVYECTKTILRDGSIELIQRIYNEFEKNKEEIMKQAGGKEASLVFAEALYSALSKTLVVPRG